MPREPKWRGTGRRPTWYRPARLFRCAAFAGRSMNHLVRSAFGSRALDSAWDPGQVVPLVRSGKMLRLRGEVLWWAVIQDPVFRGSWATVPDLAVCAGWTAPVASWTLPAFWLLPVAWLQRGQAGTVWLFPWRIPYSSARTQNSIVGDHHVLRIVSVQHVELALGGHLLAQFVVLQQCVEPVRKRGRVSARHEDPADLG